MRSEKKVGIFFMVAVLILVLLLELMEEKPFIKRKYLLRTYFQAVNGLELGDPVRLGGVKVGEVKRIKIAGNRIEVAMSVDKNISVREDSKATIRMTSLLGGKYLNLSLGSPTSPSLKPNDVVPAIDSPDLDQLASNVNEMVTEAKTLAKSFNENQNAVMGRIAKLLEDHEGDIQTLLSTSPQLKDTFASLSNIAKRVEKGEGTLGKLLTDETLYEDVKRTVQQIGRAAESIQDQTPIMSFGSILLGVSR